MPLLTHEIKRFQTLLSNRYEASEALNISSMVVEELLGIPFMEQRINRQAEINAEQVNRLNQVLQRLLQNEPIQHILGFAWFMNERFWVNSATLIPRPETEELVHWIIQDYKDHTAIRVLDLGCGSGCIAISLAKRLKKSNVSALDISESAINTAMMNDLKIRSGENPVAFHRQDLFDPTWWKHQGKFDVIVSNPPYVREEEKQGMDARVVDFEPASALFVPNQDALKYYRFIAAIAAEHLSSEGALYFEINQALGQETSELLESLGYKTQLRKDMQGADRMVKGTKG